ncbi:MAG: plasmid mobilization protein [Flavisolibacter sp.]
MKKTEQDFRKKYIAIYFSQTELAQIVKSKNSTCEKTMSSYLRKIVLNKPVLVKYRNATGDDFLREMLELKKELKVLVNNYEQAVKKLLLLEKIPEFRSWLITYENSRVECLLKVEQIQLHVIQLYERWLQR